MRITSFTIKNFKSIKNLTIPVSTYGKGKDQSSMAILVGLNESGKSSILEAINLWSLELDDVDYDDYLHKGAQDDDNDIWIEAKLEIEERDYFNKKLAEAFDLDEKETNHINIVGLTNITYRNKANSENYYLVEIDSGFPFHEYIYSKEEGIQKLKEVNKITEVITEKNAKTFLLSGQILLTKTDLESLIPPTLKSEFNSYLPSVSMWKPKPEYLINEAVDLNAFMVKPSVSIPLKNIFRINGIDTTEKIKAKIVRALLKPENKAELQKTLSKGITTYINKIWKEHRINIVLNIDGSSCSVHIEDKDKEHKYYSMDQRSDGFNQFVSLILSLSTQNDSKELTDNIILLDEPEIHLHPSGVRYMRDELLKIGKNNILFVSTHSHYMVDTTTPERHYIVSKKSMKTEITQIKEDTSMSDDQVLANAFGLNLFKELLPQYILVVEGGDDKAIISHSLDLLYDDFSYSIKSAGGASKIYGIASLMAQESIPAYFILDDDKEGRDVKKEILANLKESFDKESVFTIKELSENIVDKGTSEDLLPPQFVKDFFEKEMEQEFQFEKANPILFQLKNQNEKLKNNKELLNSKKVKLSDLFVETYSSKEMLEKEAPKLVKLLKELVKRIQS